MVNEFEDMIHQTVQWQDTFSFINEKLSSTSNVNYNLSGFSHFKELFTYINTVQQIKTSNSLSSH